MKLDNRLPSQMVPCEWADKYKFLIEYEDFYPISIEPEAQVLYVGE